MEETKTSTQKLSYDDLEKLALQLQQRLLASESKLKEINFVELRLSWLFKVLEYKGSVSFDTEFLNKVIKCDLFIGRKELLMVYCFTVV